MRELKDFCLEEYRKAISDHPDDGRAVMTAVKEAAELGDSTQAQRLLKMAESDDRVVVRPEQLDANPWLIGTGNGVVDLRSGEFRAGKPDDYITKATGVMFDPAAACPRFEKFLLEIFQNDYELAKYIVRAIGYSLTGSTTEQSFIFMHGTGSNGKTRLIETLLGILGDYGITTAPEVVTVSKHETPMHHLADLHGARFVTLPETEEGHRLAESRIKYLTGGDKITACRKYEAPFRFTPQLKLWFHGNHKPEIRGTDNGIWRRVKLVPFLATFPPGSRDDDLQEKLNAELPGILNLAIEGCLEWQRDGMQYPDKVQAATSEYRTEQDVLAEFLEDRTCLVTESRVSRAQMYAAYKEWAESRGQRLWSDRAFSKNLNDRGINAIKSNGTRYWVGLRLTPPPGQEGH